MPRSTGWTAWSTGWQRVAGNAEQVVERIIPITGAADAVLESVGATSAGAQALLEIFQPMTERGAPLLQHFLDEFSVEELQALIRLVDQVPQFTEHMETDIMPVLCKLDQVGPDVHELLDVLKDVRLAIHGLPGFALFRRRGADREDELDEDRRLRELGRQSAADDGSGTPSSPASSRSATVTGSSAPSSAVASVTARSYSSAAAVDSPVTAWQHASAARISMVRRCTPWAASASLSVAVRTAMACGSARASA